MFKLLKIIFNRITIVCILLLIQIFMLVLVLQEVSEYFKYLNILFYAVSTVYAIKLLVKNISPAFKLPIIPLLIFFPFIGIFLYYFSFENKMRKKLVKNFKNQTFTLESLYIEDASIREQLLSENKLIYHHSQYIANNTFLPVYRNTYTKYFDCGESFFESMIEDLKNAKHFIFLEFFIIGNGVLWNSILTILKQKVKQGVEVRVIFDDIGSMKVLPYKYNMRLEKLGIKCVAFSPLAPILSLSHNNRDHKKIVVIDGQIAYTGGLNIADEYVNKKERFGHWKDTGIKISGDATKSFSLMFLEAWHYFRDSSEECSIYLNVPPMLANEYTGYVQPYIGDPMSDNDVARDVYINIINTATDYLYITTPYFSVDQELESALISASKRGVDVRIVTPHIPDKKYIFRITQSYYRPLLKYGVKFFEYAPGFIHSKIILADDKLATVGTVNFDYRSFYHNYECGVWMYNTNSIKEIRNDFSNIFNKAIKVTDEYIDSQIGFFKHLMGEILKLFAPLL